MIREFLNYKYGEFVTTKFLSSNNEVIWDYRNPDGVNEQLEVKKHLKELRDSQGNRLVPDKFLSIDWGMDFSSWLGEFKTKKEYLFIGAEPHINHNYQLVYDFGNRNGEDLKTTAINYAKNQNDIWHYIVKNFAIDSESELSVLQKCYITDLCPFVPKGCGQVKDIQNKLGITKKEWDQFRSRIAMHFLEKEVNAVNPKFIVLHGEPSRTFFNDKLLAVPLHFKKEDEIGNWKRYVYKGKMKEVKIIAIPHLKGQILNELWRSKKHPERIESIKNIIQDFIKD